MDDSTSVPAKRRKIDENCEHSVSDGGDQITKPKVPLNLNIKPQALARLRQIAKNSNIGGTSPQKHTELSKDEIKETNSHDSNQNNETGQNTDLLDAQNSNDVIISSAGSSPAHSPKPEDLVVLSTPPKKPPLKESLNGTKTVLKNLFSLPDQSEHRDPNEKDSKKPNNNHGVTANGVDNPSSTPIAPLNFGTAELKKVLKAMIDEKFKQVEDIYMSQGTESELKDRIVKLEDENKSLQEYASKLEKAVKLLLDKQNNKKEKHTKGAQTEDIGLSRLRSPTTGITPSTPVLQVSTTPKTILQAPPPTLTPTSPLSLQPQQQQINQVNKPGTLVTSRLTATQAAIPGHSVTPASLPQRMSYPPQQILVSSPQPQRPVQYQTVTPARPAPVTVTVHPQTTTTTMISSPTYQTQVQKAAFVTNNVARQPVPPQQPLVQQRMPTSQPMVMYQRLPVAPQGPVQPVPAQFPNAAVVQRPVTQSPQPVNNQTRTLQNPIGPQLPPNLAVSPRDQVNNVPAKDLPGRPVVSIAVVSNGIVLSWNMANQPQTSTRIARYQLFALQDVGSNTAQWKKIGVVNALPLPMACTLTQFMPGNKYHFTVRAQDEHGRCGPLSEPCTVTLT